MRLFCGSLNIALGALGALVIWTGLSVLQPHASLADSSSAPLNAPLHAPLPELQVYPEDLVYTELPEASPQAIESELSKLQSITIAAGLESVSRDESGVRHSLLEMDEVFADFECDHVVLIKFNAQPSKLSYRNRLIRDSEGGVLFHGETRSGIPFAIYSSQPGAQSIAQTNLVNSLVRSMGGVGAFSTSSHGRLRSEIARTLARVAEFIIPSAQAGTGEMAQACEVRKPADSLDAALKKAVPKNSGNAFVRTLLSCGKGIGIGIVSSTKGAAESIVQMSIQVGKGLIYTVKHPFKAVANAARMIYQLPGKILRSFKRTGHDAKQLNPTDWARVICQIATEVGVGVATGLIVSGKLPVQRALHQATVKVFRRSTEGTKLLDVIQTGRLTGTIK